MVGIEKERWSIKGKWGKREKLRGIEKEKKKERVKKVRKQRGRGVTEEEKTRITDIEGE